MDFRLLSVAITLALTAREPTTQTENEDAE